ncbi:hypothetical protein [Mastigocladopsis repens]|uniref:hypothetical protein n=1 Tax=Mastigocladopsis repens TaxID=221287 RepID=UPI0012EA9A89|nr:hypothetical protein [Mastigocladopsis repens]
METVFCQSQHSNPDSAALCEICSAYGGNAKAMRIISGVIRADFECDIDAYWNVTQNDLLIEQELENLVVSQFNRLQEIDPEAYRLLCRLECYRYQDVSRVPIDGLVCLLWDLPESQRRRVVNSLRARSLVECRQGEYWLHPVILEEAIALFQKMQPPNKLRKYKQQWGVFRNQNNHHQNHTSSHHSSDSNNIFVY